MVWVWGLRFRRELHETRSDPRIDVGGKRKAELEVQMKPVHAVWVLGFRV